MEWEIVFYIIVGALAIGALIWVEIDNKNYKEK
jgi:hypothetical protein